MPRLFPVLLLFLIFSAIPLQARDVPVSRISDDSSLRIRLKDLWFIETPASVLSRRPTIERLPTGERVEVRAINGNTEIMVLLSRENSAGQFPGWAQGSWMLTRRRDTGAGTRIRFFPRSDQHTYIDFRPLNADRSQMDVIVYGGYITRALPIGVPFERLYTMQLNDILRLAGDRFPYHFFNPDPALYRDTRNFVSQVRQRLGEVNYANNDGAIDENGNYVFIETLEPQTVRPFHVNCSGFVKWLIDGCLRPVTGKRLDIAPLKEPFGERGSSFTARWENFDRVSDDIRRGDHFYPTNDRLIERQIPLSVRRDPYFGLDWIRNLASEANGILRSSAHRALDEFEVRNDNFSMLQGRDRVIINYSGFLPDAGYSIEGLLPLLYTLAIENPFSFYLGAISDERGAPITPDNPRGGPRLRQFFHVVALVPYFDESGNFRVVVFESASESSIDRFIRRYRHPQVQLTHHINLVQVPVPARFDP